MDRPTNCSWELQKPDLKQDGVHFESLNPVLSEPLRPRRYHLVEDIVPLHVRV